jgi:hypothetical protein
MRQRTLMPFLFGYASYKYFSMPFLSQTSMKRFRKTFTVTCA